MQGGHAGHRDDSHPRWKGAGQHNISSCYSEVILEEEQNGNFRKNLFAPWMNDWPALGVMCERKKIAFNPKGKFRVRETYFSLSPTILNCPERETTQFHLRMFLMRNQASYHLAAEGQLLKKMGHVHQAQDVL